MRGLENTFACRNQAEHKKATGLSATISAILLVFVLVLSGCSAQSTSGSSGASNLPTNDIVVLYTNDVHCGVDEKVGYAALSDYKNRKLQETPYVTLVDVGDAIQGAPIGLADKGEHIIDIMNACGYEYSAIGNHDFDYGTDQLADLMKEAKFQYLACNTTYTGSEKNNLSSVKPYDIKKYGNVSVGFVGVTTPETVKSSNPQLFKDEQGNAVYDFAGNSGDEFYGKIQSAVDECKSKGADYVVVLAHLGDIDNYQPFSSRDIIHHTTGIDAVLDGHAHSTIEGDYEKNKDGQDVVLSSTGTKLNAFGQLVIGADGSLKTTLVKEHAEKDPTVTNRIQVIEARLDADLKRVVASSNTALSISDSDGNRMVRARETGIGNLCTDALRRYANADIAIMNGGNIRADLPSGDITYNDLKTIFPFNNTVVTVSATGQQILDALEYGASKTLPYYVKNNEKTGESGGFMQVSGVKYSIDTSKESAVKTDANGAFVSVDGDRRVLDVQVLNSDGSYEPIDPARTYKLTSIAYVIQQGGDGMTMFQKDEILEDDGAMDATVLAGYINNVLKGDLQQYVQTEGRITVY